MSEARISRLLIDEPPLQVLPSLACELGLNEAIFVQQLHYWLRSRYATEHDGEMWIYNSYESWQEQFPFLSVATVKRVITACEKRGIVKTSTRFNSRNGDRTKWYTLDYEALEVEDATEEKIEDDVYDPSLDPQTISSEQEVNLTRATGQSDPTEEVNLTRALPETTQRVTTENTTTEVVEDPQTISSEPLPDDVTGACLLLLSKVAGFPRDQGENAMKLAEYREEFPGADPVEVCRDFKAVCEETGKKATRLRLRNFFKQADKRSPARASPSANARSRNGSGGSRDVEEGYEWLFGNGRTTEGNQSMEVSG